MCQALARSQSHFRPRVTTLHWEAEIAKIEECAALNARRSASVMAAASVGRGVLKG